MKRKNKKFYIWAMYECIKTTYEQWGLDMMSMYKNIKRDFPNAALAIKKMYSEFNNSTDCYNASALSFDNVQYVYEAIANLIPFGKVINFDIRTKEQDKQYEYLNICSWDHFVEINRIDLIMAILLFTEEFILNPISDKKVIFKENKLIVYGNFVIFKIVKHRTKTYVSIRIRNVSLIEYIIRNSNDSN